MKDRYELIDSFPSSMPKYEVSLLATTLEGERVNPCDSLYESVDRHKNESVEDIVERFAFEEPEKLQLYYDAKSKYFNSRRVEPILLTRYLTKKYGYDSVHISDYRDDKSSLFLMLFHECYNEDDNSLDDDFIEARVASHRFKEKRDRMTTVEETFDFENIIDKIVDFEEIMNTGDKSYTICESYENKSKDTLTVLIRQEHKRKKIPTFEFRTTPSMELSGRPNVTHVENYPIRENAIMFKKVEDGTEIQTYAAVSSWDETLMRFFTTTIDMDIVSRLSGRQSKAAKEIMEEVKENASESSGSPESGARVQDIVSNHVKKAAEDVEDESSSLSEDFIEKRLEEIIVTGVYVDSTDTTFEIHTDNGIYTLLDEYEGMAASLSQAVSNAEIDDISIYAQVPSNGEEDDEIVLENGEWYMSSNSNQSTMKALEAALK